MNSVIGVVVAARIGSCKRSRRVLSEEVVTVSAVSALCQFTAWLQGKHPVKCTGHSSS